MATVTMTAAELRRAILAGSAPDNLRISGHLDLSGERDLTRLPDGLEVTRLTLRACWGLRRLPSRLRAFEVDAGDSGLSEIPADVRVESALRLAGCVNLGCLPENLRVGTLDLHGCTRLEALPEGLNVDFLDISDCIALTAWPVQATLRVGRIIARNCTGLTILPPYLTRLSQLDVSGCRNLTALPEGLRVTSWLDIAETQITDLPASLRGVRLRWRGVLVNEHVVFRPETITGLEVLATANAEVRRVMVERMGLERFLNEVRAQVLDADRDPGGERRLLRVPLPGDEDLVCLSVHCPSTGRHYLLRVPPIIRRCRQAAAWIAGYDNENEYQPLAET